jgi:hypothetical protein
MMAKVIILFPGGIDCECPIDLQITIRMARLLAVKRAKGQGFAENTVLGERKAVALQATGLAGIDLRLLQIILPQSVVGSEFCRVSPRHVIGSGFLGGRF